jgi:hypothetical protein
MPSALVVLLVAFCSLGARAERDAGEGEKLFERALASRFDAHLVQRAEIVTTDQKGAVSERTVEMAIKRIGGRVHSLGHITSPEHLRGVRILSIENRERSDDQFLFLPESKRVRRISGAQRADAFLGTDVIFDDLERHYPAEYVLEDGGESDVDGERALVVAARPKFDAGFDLGVYFIGLDAALLEVRFFRDGVTAPYRIVRAPRAETSRFGDVVLPGLLLIDNYRRGTRTRVTFSDTQTGIELPDALFSVDALERSQSIPGLSGR